MRPANGSNGKPHAVHYKWRKRQHAFVMSTSCPPAHSRSPLNSFSNRSQPGKTPQPRSSANNRTRSILGAETNEKTAQNRMIVYCRFVPPNRLNKRGEKKSGLCHIPVGVLDDVYTKSMHRIYTHKGMESVYVGRRECDMRRPVIKPSIDRVICLHCTRSNQRYSGDSLPPKRSH